MASTSPACSATTEASSEPFEETEGSACSDSHDEGAPATINWAEALEGANWYSLARELAGSAGHEAALARYEKRLRPFVVANQDIDIHTGEGIDETKNAFDFDA